MGNENTQENNINRNGPENGNEPEQMQQMEANQNASNPNIPPMYGNPNQRGQQQAMPIQGGYPSTPIQNQGISPRQMMPQQNVPPRQMMPQQNVPPRQVMPQQNVPPRQVMPQQNVPPRQVMPQQNMPPRQMMPYQYYQKPQIKHPDESATRYALMGVPVMIYAIICAICLYRNWSGIITSALSFISIGFISFSLVRYEKQTAQKNDGEITTSAALAKQNRLIIYFVGMVLFGVAECLTADKGIIFICNSGILVLEIFGLLSYFNNVKRWGLLKAFIVFWDVLVSPFIYIGEAFIDYSALKKNNGKKGHKGIYVFLGIVIVIPILVFVLKLLAEADEVFASVIESIFGRFLFSPDVVFWAIFAFIIFLFVYGMVVKMPKRDFDYLNGKNIGCEPVIGITITGVLTVFYLIFSVIQILYLFINNMKLPDGMSYAQYARHGFFQLLFVAILNLVIVLLCIKLFKKSTVLKVILTVMSVCTYIMIASSVVRMVMYIKEYDLTYARFIVLFMLALTAVLMVGVVIRIFSDVFPLFNYIFLAIMAMLILYAYSRPANIIANYNLNQTHDREVDLEYVMRLCDDAVPAVCEYLEENNYKAGDVIEADRFLRGDVNIEIYLTDIIRENKKYGAIRGFNFSRYNATKYAEDFLDKYPASDTY